MKSSKTFSYYAASSAKRAKRAAGKAKFRSATAIPGGMKKGMSGGMKRSRVTSRVTPAPLPALLAEDEFIPQAIVKEPVERFASPKNIVSDVDDLDRYEGIGFYLGRIPFTIMHYDGHPPNTSTIYLPHRIDDVDKITRLVQQILSHFKVAESDIVWQRKDDPDL
jgi:hypothetical protein